MATKYLYHKSGTFNRDSILRNGLIPQVGPSYKAHWNDDENLKPFIFLYDHAKVQDGEYDTTYDDDIYAIDVKQLDREHLRRDPDRDMKGCWVYDQKISPSAIKLIYKGSKKDSGDLTLHRNIYKNINNDITIVANRGNGETYIEAMLNGSCIGYLIVVIHNTIYDLESEISDTDSYEVADEVITKLDSRKRVIELADITVNREYRNMGISKRLLEYILDTFKNEQFYMRVCPTDGIDEQTLANSVKNYGFTEIDNTENGTFLIKRNYLYENKTKYDMKINESKFRNIIAESVKKTLSEMDWKTYAAAAAKDTDPNRRYRFLQKANDEYNKKYFGASQKEMLTNPNKVAPFHKMRVKDENGNLIDNPQEWGGSFGGRNMHDLTDMAKGNQPNARPLGDMSFNDIHQTMDAAQEMCDFKDGKYERVKGKGWQLKDNKVNENNNMKKTIKLNEATIRKIVAESLKRALRESEDFDDNMDYDFDDDNAEVESLPNDYEKKAGYYDDKGYLKKGQYQSPVYDEINQKLEEALGGGDVWAIVDRAVSDTNGRNITISSNDKSTLNAVRAVMEEMGYKFIQENDSNVRFTPDGINMSFHEVGLEYPKRMSKYRVDADGNRMKPHDPNYEKGFEREEWLDNKKGHMAGEKQSVVSYTFAKRSK